MMALQIMTEFGDFQLLEELGSGRWGTVFKARQISLDRLVAIKILHAEALPDANSVAAFRQRVDAAALVEHPGIARTYTWGEHDGRHFIVMAYVPGRTLESLMAEQTLVPRDAAQLVRQAAEALHAAHQRGILHGGLHPGQVLVARDGKARVTDLGFRSAEPTWITEPRLQSYLAPEQLGLVHPNLQRHGIAADEVDPRSDVFSLGALLYTLLCGTPPYGSTADRDQLLKARLELPPSPARLNPQVDADLESICLRCLRSSRHRYYSAIELVADLVRWLNGRPLAQQRLGIPRRLTLRLKRMVPSSSLRRIILLLGVLPLAGQFINGLIERFRADDVLPRADASIGQYQSALSSVEVRLRWHPHQRPLQVQHGLALYRLRRFAEAKQAVWDGFMPPRHYEFWTYSRSFPVNFIQEGDAFYHDQNALAWQVLELSALATQDVDALERAVTRFGGSRWEGYVILSAPPELRSQGSLTWLLARQLDPTQRSFLWAGMLRQLATHPKSRSLDLRRSEWVVHGSPVARAHADGTWKHYVADLASSGGPPSGNDTSKTVRILLDVLEGGEPPYQQIAANHLGAMGPTAVMTLADPDERVRLAAADALHKIDPQWRDTDADRQAIKALHAKGLFVEVGRFTGHTDGVIAVAISADGRRALSGSWHRGNDRTVRLWDIATAAEVRRLEGHAGAVTCVALSPDGKRALSGSLDQTVRLWDLESGQELNCFRGHEQTVHAVLFSPDGKSAVSAAYEKPIRIWDLQQATQRQILQAHTDAVRGLAISSDGRLLASSSFDGSVLLWDFRAGTVLRTLWAAPAALVVGVAFSPDDRLLVSGGYDRLVRIWDVNTGRELQRMAGHEREIHAVAFAPDGRRVLSGSYDTTLRLWDVKTGKQLHRYSGHTDLVLGVACTPDGRYVLSASYDKTVREWTLGSALPEPTP